LNNNERCEIFVHALVGLSAPQTLIVEIYIKKKKVIILIDLGSTHNFIDKILEESLNFCVYPMTNFQFLVANRGSFKCHNIILSMGEYNLGISMYAIPIGGVDISLGIHG
jgi:hypothetical protein